MVTDSQSKSRELYEKLEATKKEHEAEKERIKAEKLKAMEAIPKVQTPVYA